MPVLNGGFAAIWVVILTDERATFRPGELVSSDTYKHQLWVRILFEDFLTWQYKPNLKTLLGRVELDTEGAL